MKRHPADGVLRRLVDDPTGVSDPDRAHVADCPHCLDALVSAQRDAVRVDAALAAAADGDVEAAWHRLSAAAAAGTRPRRTASARLGGVRAALRRPAVAALAAAVVLGGGATAAANGWLQIFRTERVAPVSLTTTDVAALPDLSAYGEVTDATDPRVRPVPDAAAAASATGLDVPEVTELPRGVTGEPTYEVGDEMSLTFTFSAERAARAAAAAGATAPPVPAGLDGSQVRFVAGPGVVARWTHSTGTPALVVARAVAPTVASSGVGFEALRDNLLSLPGLPEGLADQLRAVSGDGSTLPLPVPADQVTTTSAEVDGAPATVLEARDRSMAAVVWVQDGVLTAVAGALGGDEVLAVAEGLR
ncbi:MAG: hypothetical protein ACLGIG_05775 [Actinomycetes bacterium]